MRGRPARSSPLLRALLASLGLHAGLGLVAWRAGRWAHAPGAEERTSVLVDVSAEPLVERVPAEPTPPPPVRAKAAVLGRRSALPGARPTPSPAAPSPPPGGTSTDPAPGPSVPIDLTGETLVIASTGRSGGGPGDASGGGAPAGRGLGDRPHASSALGSGTGDRSGGVALDDHRWTCPWPREADADRIDEQSVVLRVVVNPDGTVESATVSSDPGHGFGAAAVACALRTRFTPARDREGRPIRAESPAVVVRFTR